MKEIPIKVLARQSLSVMLEQSLYEISLKECNGIMAATIIRDGVTLVDNRRCLAGMTIIPEGYLEEGNFVILTENGELPYYTGFESNDVLVYLTMEEVSGIRQRYPIGPLPNSIPSGPLTNFNFNENKVSYGMSLARASVGTYIKSNQLLTAAINIPRFEDSGLLVESQSTNLTYPSESWPASVGASGSNIWVHSAIDSSGWISVTGGTDTGFPEGSYRNLTGTTIQSKTVTLSMDVKKVAGYKFMIRAYVSGSGSDGLGNSEGSFSDGQPLPTGSMWKIQDMGSWLRISLTRKFGDGTSILRLYPFGPQVNASGSLTYRRVQVEALDIATSYIKTTSAPLTRSPDVTTLTQPNPKTVYREYIPIGSASLIKEIVTYNGVLVPPNSHLQRLIVWNRALTNEEIKLYV